MKILHALPPAAGGMLRHVECLVSGLDPSRYEQYCAAPPGFGLESVSTYLPNRTFALPLRNFTGFIDTLQSAWGLARAARTIRPDLIHGHGYRGMLVAALASRLSGRDYVCTAHTLPGELGLRFWRTVRPLITGSRGAICVSKAIARDLAEYLPGGSCPPLRVVPNGIDPGEPPGLRIPLPPELLASGCRPIVLCAARLAPQKGVGVLLQAWANLAPRFPFGVLVIAGEGPLLSELEQQATHLGIKQRIRFPGFRSDVRSLLRAADIAVVPSLAEGQSVFVLEAMAEGAPVVASRVGGIPEMVRDGETGLLVPPGDPEALAAAMERLFIDEALVRQVTASARAFVDSEMTIERMLARTDAFYQECVRKSPLRGYDVEEETPGKE